jgi:hypothetical protein
MPKTTSLAKAIAAAGLTLGVTIAGAAEPIGSFARIEGVAVVSKGAQYVKAHEGMPLKEGDRLMVMEGGRAILAFNDGCQYQVADNEVLTIGATSTCAANSGGSYKVDPYSAVSKAPDSAAQHFRPAAVGGTAAAGSLAWVVPAAVGTVAVIGAAADTGSDSDNPPRVPLSP